MNPQLDLFSAADLFTLRNELRTSGLDSFQAAELIAAFLAHRGYGVSPQEVRNAVGRLDRVRCDLVCMRQELQQLALMM